MSTPGNAAGTPVEGPLSDEQPEVAPDDRCGTYAGWMAHRRRGEQPCGFCRSAAAEYQREHRLNPDAKRRNLERCRARGAALKELGRQYPDEYQRLYVEALAEIRGIDLGRGAA